jgi:signal transduction histidine kinase
MDLAALCREVVDEALAAHPAQHVSLEASGDLRGRWDRARLAQVLSNLLGNLLTHGDEAEPVQLIATADSVSVAVDVVNRDRPSRPSRSRVCSSRSSGAWEATRKGRVRAWASVSTSRSRSSYRTAAA